MACAGTWGRAVRVRPCPHAARVCRCACPKAVPLSPAVPQAAVQKPTLGAGSRGDGTVTWSNPDQCQAFVKRLQVRACGGGAGCLWRGGGHPISVSCERVCTRRVLHSCLLPRVSFVIPYISTAQASAEKLATENRALRKLHQRLAEVGGAVVGPRPGMRPVVAAGGEGGCGGDHAKVSPRSPFGGSVLSQTVGGLPSQFSADFHVPVVAPSASPPPPCTLRQTCRRWCPSWALTCCGTARSGRRAGPA